jgi:hypothetical protein
MAQINDLWKRLRMANIVGGAGAIASVVVMGLRELWSQYLIDGAV